MKNSSSLPNVITGASFAERLRRPDIERLIAAYRREKADRVPNFEECIDQKITEYILGKPTGCDYRALPLADAIEMAHRIGQDCIQFQAGVWLAGPLDRKPPFCAMEDLERWQPPDPEPYVASLREYRKAVNNSGLGIGVMLTGPFYTGYTSMGPILIQSFLENLYLDLPFVEALLELHTQAQLRIVEAIIDEPIDFFQIHDDTCDSNGFMCPPELMDRIWVPRIRRTVDLVKQKGVPVDWHCCGKLDPLLPYLLDWGVDCVQPVQPRCNDIYELKEKFGDRIAFRGNMSIEGVLAFGTPDEVRADTRQHIERLSYDGGYIVASSHSITDAIPPENFATMLDATWEYGEF